jgi:hypothetical protein
LQNIWDENSCIYFEKSGRLSEIYESENGFEQWKIDGEYLMSSEFVEELIINCCNPNARCSKLINTWIGKAFITNSFDSAKECYWPESNRDAAVFFMETMIECYLRIISGLSDGLVKNEFVDIIDHLDFIKNGFGSNIIFNYGNRYRVIYEKQSENM